MATPATSSSSGFATVSTSPDIRLFYQVTPALPLDPARPVLVLSNSLAASTALWDAFTAAFVPTHTIVRYDGRFQGQSPLPATPDGGVDYAAGHTMQDLADDVLVVLDTLGIQRAAAFIGLSIGAGTGLVLAAQHADRFGSFVIVGTRSHADAQDAQRFAERAAYYREHGARAQALQSVQRWFGAAWTADPANAAAVEHVVRAVVDTPVEGLVANAAALTRLDVRPDAATIKQAGLGRRVLFVAGAADPVLKESRQLAALAGSRQEVVADAGHIVTVQQPERFHELVRAWLATDERE